MTETRTYHFRNSEPESPSEILDRLARDEMETFPEFSYQRALDRVMARRPELVRAYGGEHGTKPPVYSEGAHPDDDPSVKLDAKARILVASGECKDYAEGVKRAMRENPALADRWANYVSAGSAG